MEAAKVLGLEAQRSRCVPLGIGIDQQGSVSSSGSKVR